MIKESMWAIVGGILPRNQGSMRQSGLIIEDEQITHTQVGSLYVDRNNDILIGRGRDTGIVAGFTDFPFKFDATGCFVLPGFIDVHVHGSDGCDTMDADPASLARMARFFARHGVTSYLPTTMTASRGDTLDAVRAVTAYMQQEAPGARILGIHLEGSFLNPKYAGAQNAAFIRPPDLEEFAEYVEAGPVRMVTLAPEMPGAHDILRYAVERGIIGVAGHTAATYEQFEAGVEAGIRQATHTYNAMTGLHHRAPGTLGAVLTDRRVYAQLIPDPALVHPAAMDVLARCKWIGQVVIITDAIRAAGLAPGEYDLGGQTVTVRDEVCRLPDGTLAGSIITMDRGLRNFMAATGWSLAHAWRSSSQNAADALGLRNLGRIAPTCLADLVVLDEALEVVATIVKGRIVYLREQDRARLPSALMGLYDGEDHRAPAR